MRVGNIIKSSGTSNSIYEIFRIDKSYIVVNAYSKNLKHLYRAVMCKTGIKIIAENMDEMKAGLL